MLKTKSWLICVLLFAVLLVACGDDDDNDVDGAATSTPAAVETTAPAGDADATSTEASEEPTEEAEMTVTLEPTEDAATPTDEADATPTGDAVTTPTQDTGAGVSTPDADATEADPGSTPDMSETPSSQAADPAVEAALFEIVLATEDLPTVWTEVRTSASYDVQTDLGLCNAEPYEGIEDRLASVEAEFEQDPTEGPFLIHDVTAYPEDQAIEAMEYAREITADCTEWTDEEGVTYTLEPQDDYPQFGDESFVLRITFEVPGIGPVPGEFVFIRVDGLLTFIGYVGLSEVDTAEVTDIAEIAVEKMENADLDS